MKNINRTEIEKFDKQYRTNFINCLSGFKGVNLIGSKDSEGHENLAVFSSTVHLGANPPLLGLVSRPIIVERNTYQNIRSTGVYTINHMNEKIYMAGHQSSARYPKNVSEFKEVGLNPYYHEDFYAPFVKESLIKLGMKLKEVVPVRSNDTVLIIGEIMEVIIEESFLKEDGFVDLAEAGTVTLAGLDAYHSVSKLERLSYAKPNKPLETINDFKNE